VESHPDAGKSKTLAQDDPDGVMTYCDGTIPSFNPMDFSEDNIPTPTVKRPEYKAPETPELPKTPEIPKQENTTANIGCPTASQQAKEPVGMYSNYGKSSLTHPNHCWTS
jgi:hypothetical protein